MPHPLPAPHTRAPRVLRSGAVPRPAWRVPRAASRVLRPASRVLRAPPHASCGPRPRVQRPARRLVRVLRPASRVPRPASRVPRAERRLMLLRPALRAPRTVPRRPSPSPACRRLRGETNLCPNWPACWSEAQAKQLRDPLKCRRGLGEHVGARQLGCLLVAFQDLNFLGFFSLYKIIGVKH